MNRREKKSLEWLDRLCTPDMYEDRLGPVRDWVKRQLAVTLTDEQIDRLAQTHLVAGDDGEVFGVHKFARALLDASRS